MQPEEWKTTITEVRQCETEDYVPDAGIRLNPRWTTKWSEDKQSIWRIQSNDSKDSRSPKNGDIDQEETENV